MTLMRMSINAQTIIAQMDQYAKDYLFPMPDNASQYNAGMRLSAFRGGDEWLIVFEMLNYIKGREFLNEIYAFGNRLICPGLQPQAVTVLEPVEGQLFWDCSGSFILNLETIALKVKGRSRQVTIMPLDWQAAGIREDSPVPAPAKLLRLMAALYQEELFEDTASLLRLCGREESGLSLFLQLSGWEHPDLAADELPGSSRSLRSLAEALAAGAAELYQCLPEWINSHWSCWPDEHWGWE